MAKPEMLAEISAAFEALGASWRISVGSVSNKWVISCELLKRKRSLSGKRSQASGMVSNSSSLMLLWEYGDKLWCEVWRTMMLPRDVTFGELCWARMVSWLCEGRVCVWTQKGDL